MMRGLRGLPAGRAFGVLLLIFFMAFGAVVVMLAVEQQRVVQLNRRLQDETVPEIIRYQRLARNIEQLRQEGERIFAVSSQAERQQGIFLVTLIASHPSVLEYPQAAKLARESEDFLGETVRQASHDPSHLLAAYATWQEIAERLGVLVDEISTAGVSQASRDLDQAAAAMTLARYKLLLAMLLVVAFLVAVMILVRRHLIRPLQRIKEALSSLSVDRPAPSFAPSVMLEIQAVEASVRQHHALLRQSEEARLGLEKLANKDGLTGLMNRRHFMELAEIELQRAQRYRRPVSVAMADLDFFKRLNDTYGHAAGDEVLRTFADLVNETLRQSDLVCRSGGEEFAFLFPEIGPLEASRLAERLRLACAGRLIKLPDGRLIKLTVSIGIADASDCPIDMALSRADEALYAAKHQGRDRVLMAVDAGQIPSNGELPLACDD